MLYLHHLACTRCGEHYAADQPHNLCRCGAPLLAQYDLERVAAAVKREEVTRRAPTMWRYRELMPLDSTAQIVSLGEGFTPLQPAPALAHRLGLKHLYIKDESINPTGSFKARGLSAAITRARALGIKKVAIPSAGNAAGATAAYAARAGLQAYVFMPRDVPDTFRVECAVCGAQVTLVDGLITDAGRQVAERREAEGWFDVSTLKEPYRVEGKKTMGYELAEQMGWTLPDLVIYPTGGGTGLIGMAKAFAEMEALGWIGSYRPRMVAVQSSGCAPIVRAFQAGDERATPWQNAYTVADGLRVPQAIGDFLMLRAIRESGGCAVAVSDVELLQGMREMARLEGIFAAPEGGATVAALHKLRAQNLIDPGERVVLFNTGSGLKYVERIKGEAGE